MAEFILFPAIILGLIIGIIELFFVHADQSFRGSHWLGHGFHAIIFAMIFIFINMNVNYILNLINIAIPYQEITVRGLVVIVAFIKIQGAASGAGKIVREKIWHTLIVVALITAAPFIWPLLKPICLNLLPTSFC